jgi:mono/diheme cytochrome c family protein
MEGGKLPPENPAVRRGLAFLLRTQLADGTWHVRSRTHTFQPPMESGFPHGKDGWISAAGTSWAVMALSTSLDPSQPPPAPRALAKAAPAVAAVVDSAPAIPVEFARDIQPLLERSCVACHSGERPKGGFEITNRTALLQGGKRGETAVIPGKSQTSPLIRFVEDKVEDMEMPPMAKRGKFPALTSDETTRLRAWIDQGASWPDGIQLRTPAK